MDVKEIHDIPSIEDYLDIKFVFNCYSFGDSIRCYTKQFGDVAIHIEIISEETEMMDFELLSDLITQKNTHYFALSFWNNSGDRINSWHYRPLLDDSEKEIIL